MSATRIPPSGSFAAAASSNICMQKGHETAAVVAPLERTSSNRMWLIRLVGESSILSAAGRHLAVRVRDIAYLEGSYDRHLLRDNVVRKGLTFGRGGKAGPVRGFGLGIDVEEDLVRRLAV